MQTQHLTSYSSLQHHIPRFNIIFLASTSYSSLQHHIPRFNIILHAPTSYSSLPPHNIHQARYNATSPTTTHIKRAPCGDIPRGMDGDAVRFPARDSRANRALVRDRREFPAKTTASEGKPPAPQPPVEKPICRGDERRRRVRPRLAERG